MVGTADDGHQEWRHPVIVGDPVKFFAADFDDVSTVAGAVTPVPGGVGPMTITMLMANTLRSARLSAGLEG